MMKKRVRTSTTLRTDRLSLMGGAALPPVRASRKREEMDRPGDEPGLTIVSGPQFDALLTLLDNPPKVSEELRREVANRRWK